MLSYLKYLKSEKFMEQIGIITKPQGIKGEFRARIDGISKDDLKTLNEVVINKQTYHVNKITFREGFVIFNVKEFTDCNQVEVLRNIPIYAEINHELEEGEVLIKDIIGFEVVLTTGEIIGKLTSIENYGASEIYVVKSDASEVMFPNVRGVIKDFEMNKKQIILNAEILQEIRIDN